MVKGTNKLFYGIYSTGGPQITKVKIHNWIRNMGCKYAFLFLLSHITQLPNDHFRFEISFLHTHCEEKLVACVPGCCNFLGILSTEKFI